MIPAVGYVRDSKYVGILCVSIDCETGCLRNTWFSRQCPFKRGSSRAKSDIFVFLLISNFVCQLSRKKTSMCVVFLDVIVFLLICYIFFEFVWPWSYDQLQIGAKLAGGRWRPPAKMVKHQGKSIGVGWGFIMNHVPPAMTCGDLKRMMACIHVRALTPEDM
jgi:hypothetical protein